MNSGQLVRSTRAFVAVLIIAGAKLLCAQSSIVPLVIVSASATESHTSADQFLTAFINAAMRSKGANSVACVATATRTRPDLAVKIVVCAFNVARLNSHSLSGRLPVALIDQIIKAAIVAAPQSAGDIVKAAIDSEPYARATILAAALATAPGERAEIFAAARETSAMSMLALAITATINPVDRGGVGDVNSPEQPPMTP